MEEPSREFYCPVTFGLLVQPHRTSCCRKQLLSELAVVTIKKEGGHCPLCRASQWETQIDEEFQHKVQALRVFCAHVDRGCQWKGKVREFDSHVASCPMKNAPLKKKQTGYCTFLTKMSEPLNVYSGHCRAPLERTELHDAAERGEVERVQRLLSTGSLNINSRTVIVRIFYHGISRHHNMYISYLNY